MLFTIDEKRTYIQLCEAWQKKWLYCIKMQIKTLGTAKCNYWIAEGEKCQKKCDELLNKILELEGLN